MRSNAVDSRFFATVAIGAALITAGLLYVFPEWGWPPLLIGLLPLLARLAWKRSPLPATALDGWLLLFAASTVWAAWISFDSAESDLKLRLLASAVITFYATVVATRVLRWRMVEGAAAATAALALYFMLTHDWTAYPVKVEVVNRIAQRWLQLRPDLSFAPTMHPNIGGNLLAVHLPLALALVLRAIRQRRLAAGLLWAVTLLVSAFGLIMTLSRGAWLALGTALGLWLLWSACRAVGVRLQRNPTPIYAVAVVLAGIAALAAAISLAGGVRGVIELLPGPANVDSRLHLYRSALSLLGDFGVLGAGINTFPGLYSYYIRISPFFLLPHAHNMVLDVWLQQGIGGLIAFVGIAATTVWLLLWPKRTPDAAADPDERLLRSALLTALAVMWLHGLVDDATYNTNAVLLWLLLPGLAVGFFGRTERIRWLAPTVTVAVVAALVLILLAIPSTRRQLTVAIDANWLAIQTAQIELAHFGPGSRLRWNDGRTTEPMTALVPAYEELLARDPENVTALYRLGRTALMARDFDGAIAYLGAAAQQAPRHEGIRQVLGFSHVWANNIPQATALLRHDAQTLRELNAYARQWREQGRDHLVRRTNRAIESLRQ